MTAARPPGPRARLGPDRALGEGRFPGFDVTAQAKHWDPVTAGVVTDRLRSPEPPRFFTLAEEATADALFDQLLDQHTEPRVPVTAMVDARLAEQRTDGWHYRDMPPDAQAWQQSLAWLDDDARQLFDRAFSRCSTAQQALVIRAISDLGSRPWHGVPAARVWSLWTRYACTAFYAHPAAWNEIGFPGPAYPRGYAALGVDKLESFEVRDSRPQDDSASGGERT